MALHYPLTDSQPDARAVELVGAVQALGGKKGLIAVSLEGSVG